MSAVLGARCGFGPGRAGHLRGAGRLRKRGVVDQRPEGVDQPRPQGTVGSAAGPHRPRRPQAQRADLFRSGHARPRRGVPAAAPDDRPGRVQRGLHHRRPHPRRPPTRGGRRRLAGGYDDADERAQRAGRQWQPPRCGHDLRSRRPVGLTCGPAHPRAAGPFGAAMAAGRGATTDLRAVPCLGHVRWPRARGLDRQDGRGRTEPADLPVLHGSAWARRHSVSQLRHG